MSLLKEAELTCSKCNHTYTPRKLYPKVCPECGTPVPALKLAFRTKDELKNFYLAFVVAGIGIFTIGLMLSFTFFPNMTGLIMGLIGLLFMLTFGSRWYTEYRIYDLLHARTGKPEPK